MAPPRPSPRNHHERIGKNLRVEEFDATPLRANSTSQRQDCDRPHCLRNGRTRAFTELGDNICAVFIDNTILHMTDNRSTLIAGYGPEHYNADMVLKVPFFLALSMLWLARNLIVPFVAGVISQKTHSSEFAELAIDHSTWLFATGSLPALMVLFAWGKRMPQAGVAVRWLWRHARPLLAFSSLADLALHYLLIPKLSKGFIPAALLLDAYILVYLAVSQRVRHVFADFPVASGP